MYCSFSFQFSRSLSDGHSFKRRSNNPHPILFALTERCSWDVKWRPRTFYILRWVAMRASGGYLRVVFETHTEVEIGAKYQANSSSPQARTSSSKLLDPRIHNPNAPQRLTKHIQSAGGKGASSFQERLGCFCIRKRQRFT